MDYVKELQKVQAKQQGVQTHTAASSVPTLPAAELDFSDLPMSANSSVPQQSSSSWTQDSSSVKRIGHSQMRLMLIGIALLIALMCLPFALSFAAMAWDGYTLNPLPAAGAIAFAWALMGLPFWALKLFMRRHTQESPLQQLPRAGRAISLIALTLGLGLAARALVPKGIDVGYWLGNEPRQAAVNAEVATTAALDATPEAVVAVASTAMDAAKPATSRTPVDTKNNKNSDPDVLTVSAGDRSPNDTNAQGQTAVHTAVQKNDPKTLHKLLLLGGRGDIGDHQGNTALHLAVRHAPQILPQLLQAMTAGAQSLDQRDSRGQTALMLAAMSGDSRAVDLLVIASASTHLQNQDGLTARQLAERNGHTNIAKQLTR